jgi:formylglycine-generating enzyme required for sulfatase activity
MRLFISLLVAGLSALTLAPAPSRGEKPGVPKHLTNSIGMKLALIPAGEFMMGSTDEERDEVAKSLSIGRSGMPAWLKAEGPRHKVRITKAFHLGIHHVTQAQFRKVMGYNPSYYSKDGRKCDPADVCPHPPAGGKEKVAGIDTDGFPVENLSWQEAADFCRKLSALPEEKKAGRVYRLPTEAEWEYACRAGEKKHSKFNIGDRLTKADANFDGNVGRPCKVGGYRPNAWGLYDMHGNVWQWCADWYGEKAYEGGERDDPKGPAKGIRRVQRGGAWNCSDSSCRSAFRANLAPGYRCFAHGFRAAIAPSGK